MKHCISKNKTKTKKEETKNIIFSVVVVVVGKFTFIKLET
jgi:hypothetical protein